MKDAYRGIDGVTGIHIDREDESLVVSLRNGTEVKSFPDNLFLELQREESAELRQEILDRFTGALRVSATSMPQSEERPFDHSALMPVLRHKASVPAEADTLSWPFASGVSIYLTEDAGPHISYLTKERAASSGQPIDVLLKTALRNLDKNFPAPPIEEISPGIWMVFADGNYESSILLSARFWDGLALQRPVAIIPARDLLVFTDDAETGAGRELARIARKRVDEYSYAISGKAYLREQGSWRALD